MSKFDLPDLPSDEELGITDEDHEAYGQDVPEERPELSKEEMVALLGQTFSPKAQPGEPEGKAKKKKKKEKKKATATPGPTPGAAPAPEGPRSRWRGPVTLAILVATAAVASSRTGLPRPVPANAADTEFSSSRAMSTLIDIARRPHPPGSPEHARVRAYLLERLSALGLEPEVQTATSVLQGANSVRAATVRNVLARIPGRAPTGAVLITAHYDSRELSPGAGDDGSGVVAILEAVRALTAGEPLRNDVIVLITDGEELDLLGARAFVDQHPWITDVSVVLSFEMRGSAGPSIMFETNDQNGWVVRALRDFDPAPFANSLAAEVYERMPNDTDFTPFKEVEKQGLNFAAVGNPRVYHQATDQPENLSEATLQHHGLRALAALRYFGSADLGTVDAPDVVYFNVPLLGLVVYSAGWVLPIAGLLVVLALGVVLLALRGGARPAGLVSALGVAILGGALAYGAALGLGGWVRRFHAEAGSLSGSLYHHEGWYVIALVAAVFAVVTGVHGLARRWLSPLELALGATLVPLVLATSTAFAAPLAAMNLQWPLAAALLAALVLALLPRGASSVWGWIGFVLLAVPVLVLLVPLTELVWVALGFGVIGAVAVLVAIALQLALPALEGLRHPNAWWAPLTGLVVAAAALGAGVASAGAGAGAPAPSTLVYAYEHGTGAAYWVTDPRADAVLDAPAIEWAEQRAGGPFSATRDVRPFGLRWESAPVATASVVNATPPEVVILEDSVEATVRRVKLATRSRIGAERLSFRRDPGGRARFLAVDGVAVDQPGSVEWIDHWGVPDTMVVLDLDMPADAPIAIHVIEDLYRPEELLGSGAFARPESLAPDVSAGSDRAVLSYSVAAFADPRHAFVPSDSAAAVGPESAPDGSPAPGAPAGTTEPSPADSAGAPADSASAAPGPG